MTPLGACRSMQGDMASARRGDLVTVDVTDLAFGGEGVARAGGYVVFRPRRCPRRPRRRPPDAGATAVRPGRDRAPRPPLDPAHRAAVPVLRAVRRLPAPARPLRGPARVQAAPGRRVPGAAGRARRRAGVPDRRGSRDLRVPQQDGVHVRRGRRPADRGAPRGRALRRDPGRRALPAPVRRDERRLRRGASVRARAGLERLSAGDRGGAPALSHAPRGTADRRGDGEPGDGLAGRADGAGAGGPPPHPVSPRHVGRPEREPEEGRGGGGGRGASDRRERDHPGTARGPHVLDLGQLLLPDEHTAGRAAVRDRGGATRG